ncbi:MAG: ArsR/SmtB family transcription factor, partial [Pseudoclavibacter sp.]
MHKEAGIERAAELFKVLGSESRLWLVRLLGNEPMTVSALTEATGMSQPLVSQHLKTLRQAGLVDAIRHGKAVTYALADEHVSHVVEDALVHAQEPGPDRRAGRRKQAPPRRTRTCSPRPPS